MFGSRDAIVRTGALAAVASTILPTALAEGFRNPPAGAFSLARAGGRIAQVDNPEAATHNPANMVDVEGFAFEPSITFVHLDVQYRGDGGGEAETRDPFKYLPNFFFTAPIQENRLSAGLAVTTPFGLSNEWEKTGKFADPNPATSWRYAAPFFTEMFTVNVNPSVGYRVNDWLSLGAGVSFYWSELTFKQFFPGMLLGLPSDPEFKAQGDGVGIGGNAGLTVNLTERQRLALTFRAPFEIEYEGDLDIGNQAAAAAAPLGATSRSDFRSEIEFPLILAAGYGIELTDSIRLEADVEWLEFSRFDTLPLHFGNNAPLVGLTEVPQDWDDTFTAGVAGDWQLTEHWAVRAGYQFYETPVPEHTFSPLIPDSNQHAFTAGFQFGKDRHNAEIAYGYIWYEDREIRDNQNPLFNGDYEMNVHLWSLAYRLAF